MFMCFGTDHDHARGAAFLLSLYTPQAFQHVVSFENHLGTLVFPVNGFSLRAVVPVARRCRL